MCFPKSEFWGTIGWIAAGLVAGFLGWSDSVNLFTMAGISAIVLGVFCFTLPNTPPPAAGQAINLRSLLMVDAFGMLKRLPFLVFIICSTLICIPLAYYYSNASGFLANMGFEQAVSAMSIGQMSEIFFMLLIPFFFRKTWREDHDLDRHGLLGGAVSVVRVRSNRTSYLDVVPRDRATRNLL